MEKKLAYIIGGLILIGISIYLFGTSGITPAGIKLYSIYKSPTGEGVSLKLERQTPTLGLVVVRTGQAYEWKITLKNEGTKTWDNSWITVRVGINGASVMKGTESGVVGDVLWEYCSQYPLDSSAPYNPNCRVDISPSGWDLKVSTNGGLTWSSPNFGVKVASIPIGKMDPGQSSTVWISLRIPQTAQDGNYPLIINGVAYFAVAGQNAIEASTYDTITVTSVEVYKGSLNLQFIGALAFSIIGLALLLRGLLI